MLLRIDDTDESRTVAGAEESIVEDLRWLGIGWDEGPVRQSDRAARYAEAASQADGAIVRDGAVRLAAPGAPEFVILRSDGSATYHWATAVDDLDFGITDVIRGNDHLSNTPLHAAAIRSLGGEPPRYLHHALILDPDEGKLSKRDDASTIGGLRDAGYPPEAVVNLLGLLGSSGPGDVLTMEELAERFDEDRLARGTVKLDPSRLRSLSTAWLRRLPAAELVARVLPFAPPGTPAEQVARARAGVARRAYACRGRRAGGRASSARRSGIPAVAGSGSRALSRPAERAAGARPGRRAAARRRAAASEARIALTGRERGPELWAVLAALPRDEAIRRAA